MVILDTSILINFLNGRVAAKRAIEKFADQEFKVTIFTKYELLRGEDSDNTAKMSAFLETLNVLDYTDEALKESILIYKELKKKGRPINEIDVLIAGISIGNKEMLLTSDRGFVEINNPYIKVIESK